MKRISFFIIVMLNFVLVVSSVGAESTEDKVERILQNIAILETEIKHLRADLDQDMKPKLKAVNEHHRTLESIKMNLDYMRTEISSIRASSDQTDKRLVELEKRLIDMLQKIKSDTKALHSQMKGELSSTRFWLQIIVGGIVVGIIILLIQIILQKPIHFKRKVGEKNETKNKEVSR